MVGDLSLAKVDSKTNPYTNKATEKKSHAFIGVKGLNKKTHSSQPLSPFQVVFSQYNANEHLKACTCRKDTSGVMNCGIIDLPTDLLQHHKELRFLRRISNR
jgi:hypothetical protein